MDRAAPRILISLLGLLLAPAAWAGAWETRTLGGTTVQVYVPTTGAVQGSGRGLMLVLHGCTQQATSLRTDGNLEPAAEAYGIVMALPQVPGGGVIAGCWDYYGAVQTRTNKHNGALFQIVSDLKEDATLGIDEDQVYVAGLSSGAGQAFVSGCLAPDIFAGVGINAGPMVGTASTQASQVAGTAAQGVTTCRSFAGNQSAHFGTQLASIIYGTMDFIVAQGYGPRNAEVLGTIYGDGAALPGAALDVTQLPGFQPAGTGTVYSDADGPRIELVSVTGMGHAFPAGSGDGFELNFIAKRGPAWPMMLAKLFSEQNRRIDPNSRPPPPLPDAGVDLDAASAADGAAPAPDANSAPDGGLAADAASSATDASAPTAQDASGPVGADAGAEEPAPSDDGGCRCVASPKRGRGSGVLMMSLLLGALGLVRRGRRRG